jgi:hypothetical protein
MSTIPTLLKFRDAAQSLAAAPDATHVLLALTPGGELATWIDRWTIDGKAGVVIAGYGRETVAVVPIDSDWAIHARDALELIDSATVEASAIETVQRIFRGAQQSPDDDPSRGYR